MSLWQRLGRLCSRLFLLTVFLSSSLFSVSPTDAAVPAAPLLASPPLAVAGMPSRVLPIADPPGAQSTALPAAQAATLSAAIESEHAAPLGLNGMFTAPGGRVIAQYPDAVTLLPGQQRIIRLPEAAPSRAIADVTLTQTVNGRGATMGLYTWLRPVGSTYNPLDKDPLLQHSFATAGSVGPLLSQVSLNPAC